MRARLDGTYVDDKDGYTYVVFRAVKRRKWVILTYSNLLKYCGHAEYRNQTEVKTQIMGMRKTEHI